MSKFSMKGVFGTFSEIVGLTIKSAEKKGAKFPDWKWSISEQDNKKSSEEFSFVNVDDEKLLDAAEKGKFATVKNMITDVHDIYALPHELVAKAALSGNLQLVKYLVEKKGLNCDIQIGRMTPLANAASKGNIKVADYLLSKGASLNATYSFTEGYSEAPLNAAVCGGKLKTVKYLLKKGATTTDETLKKVFQCENVKTAENILKILIIDHNLDTNIEDFNDADILLSSAISMKSTYLVKTILEGVGKASIDKPLIQAIELDNLDSKKKIEIIKLLFKHGEPTDAAKLVSAAGGDIKILEAIKNKVPEEFSNSVKEKIAALKNENAEATEVTALQIYEGNDASGANQELNQEKVEEIHTESDFNH